MKKHLCSKPYPECKCLLLGEIKCPVHGLGDWPENRCKICGRFVHKINKIEIPYKHIEATLD